MGHFIWYNSTNYYFLVVGELLPSKALIKAYKHQKIFLILGTHLLRPHNNLIELAKLTTHRISQMIMSNVYGEVCLIESTQALTFLTTSS